MLNVTILAYLVVAYGVIGSKEADGLCISRLILERLKDQFCFRTREANKPLTFQGSEKWYFQTRTGEENMEKITNVAEEQREFAVDATVTSVIEELYRDLKLDTNIILKDFIAS